MAISATLNQAGRPVAFMSQTLHGSERCYPAVEKEATAIVEAIRKWKHLLARQHLTLITPLSTSKKCKFYTSGVKLTPVKDSYDRDVFAVLFLTFAYLALNK